MGVNRNINEDQIFQIVNEIDRPFQFISMLEDSENSRHCYDCQHCTRKSRLLGMYYEPYYVCELTKTELDWIVRDPAPSNCPLQFKQDI